MQTPTHRFGSVRPARFAAIFAVGVGAAGMSLFLFAGDPKAPEPAPPASKPAGTFTTQIRVGPATPRVDTGTKDAQGNAVTVSCSTCHTTTKPNRATNSAAQLKQFHQGLKYNHGNLTCISCHNDANYDQLRLADGRALEFPETMTLCSQCHGQKRIDYDHGAHGGMNGYWDLKRGGRTRNTCVNCHDPHWPTPPLVIPVLQPRDRLSVPAPPEKPQRDK